MRSRTIPNLVSLAAQAVNKQLGKYHKQILFDEDGDIAEKLELPVDCAKHLKHNFCRYDKEYLYPICNASTFQAMWDIGKRLIPQQSN